MTRDFLPSSIGLVQKAEPALLDPIMDSTIVMKIAFMSSSRLIFHSFFSMFYLESIWSRKLWICVPSTDYTSPRNQAAYSRQPALRWMLLPKSTSSTEINEFLGEYFRGNNYGLIHIRCVYYREGKRHLPRLCDWCIRTLIPLTRVARSQSEAISLACTMKQRAELIFGNSGLK